MLLRVAAILQSPILSAVSSNHYSNPLGPAGDNNLFRHFPSSARHAATFDFLPRLVRDRRKSRAGGTSCPTTRNHLFRERPWWPRLELRRVSPVNLSIPPDPDALICGTTFDIHDKQVLKRNRYAGWDRYSSYYSQRARRDRVSK